MELDQFVKALDELEHPPLLVIIAKTKLRWFCDGQQPTDSLGHILEPNEPLAIHGVDALENLRLTLSK